MEDKLLTTREVSRILGVSEKEVIDMANANILPHFKVAGEFIRFKREDIINFKETIKKKYNLPQKKPYKMEALRGFFYFNDFYIICTVIILFLVWFILKDFY